MRREAKLKHKIIWKETCMILNLFAQKITRISNSNKKNHSAKFPSDGVDMTLGRTPVIWGNVGSYRESDLDFRYYLMRSLG